MIRKAPIRTEKQIASDLNQLLISYYSVFFVANPGVIAMHWCIGGFLCI